MFQIFVVLSASDVGLFSTGSGTQNSSHAVLLVSVTKGSLCRATSDVAPGPQLEPQAQQRPSETRVTEPGTTADRAERPEGPV